MDNLSLNKNFKEKIRDYKDLIKESQEKITPKTEKEKIKIEKIENKLLENTSVLTEGKKGENVVVQTNAQQKKIKRQKEIEKTLSKDLEAEYLNMPSFKQREFREVGEKTAIEINKLLDKTKIKVKKIINLIKKWLSIIPGINKFFLEQEAKIKADEIIKIKHEMDNS